MNETVYLAALNKCLTGNWRIAHDLLGYFGSAGAVFSAGQKELTDLMPGMEAVVLQLISGNVIDEASNELEYCRKEGLEVLTPGSHRQQTPRL